MNISFKKDVCRSYMVIEKVAQFSNQDFPVRMLGENEIPGLLKTSYENINGHYNMLYDISSKQAFSKMFERGKMSFQNVKALVFSLKGLMRSLEEYLLDADNIILKQECIFTDPEGKQFSYCYFPYYNGDLLLELRELLTSMLSLVDYEDEKAVRLVYELHSAVQLENFTIQNLLDAYHQVAEPELPKIQKMTPKEEEALYDLIREAPDSWEEETAIPEEEEAGFFEKMKYYLKGRKLMDVLGDINEGEFLEKVRQCGRVPSRTPAYVPADVMPMQEAASISYYPVRDEADDIIAEEIRYGIPAEGVERRSGLHREKRSSRLPDLFGEDRKEDRYDGFGTDSSRPVLRPDPFLAGAAVPGGTVLLHGQGENMLTGIHAQQGVSFPIHTFPFTVGKTRGSCEAILEEPTVSRMHARIYCSEGQCYIEDLNSTNGTFVNGSRLDAYKKTPVSDGDILCFAQEEFCFHIKT